jgi:hypothetical protein
MLTPSLPCSLADLLAAFAPCFTQPTMRTFQALVAGFLAQPGRRTVTGMLTGAGLAGRRHHDVAYRFFATARWSADQVGLVLLDLITAMLVPASDPIVLAVDDTLWRRCGRKLHGAAWHHDGNGPGRHRPAWGHRWVVVGVICHPPFVRRAICLPILARLWTPGDADHTPLQLARELLDLVVAHVGTRPVHLVGDAAYVGTPLQGLPAHVTVTARLRADAALYQPAPPPTGRRGRPRVKGDRLPELIVLAALTRYRWTPLTLRCYGQTQQREVLAIHCLWYGALKAQPVQVVLSRPVGAPDGYQLALATTDLAATQPRSSNATATAGQQKPHSWTAPSRWRRPGPHPHPALRGAPDPLRAGLCEPGDRLVRPPRPPRHDLAAHRARAPWYRTKRTVSVADMLAALRRALLAAPAGRPISAGSA